VQQLEGLVGLEQAGVPGVPEIVEIETTIDVAVNNEFRVFLDSFNLGTVELQEVLGT
jgi:hypothetical protein